MKLAKSAPAEHGLPFSRWSLAKLADFLVVEDISHEGLRALLRAEGVSFQAFKTWKASTDPDYAVKKARVEHLYAIADGEVTAETGDPRRDLLLVREHRCVTPPATPIGSRRAVSPVSDIRWKFL